MKTAVLLSICIALAIAQTYTINTKYWRNSFDGYGNNAANPKFGSANSRLQRAGPAHFGDGMSTDRKSKAGAALPSPRFISNTVHVAPTTGQPKNLRGLTGYTTYWGQFLAHDIDLTGGPAGSAMPLQPISIDVPKGDPFFDPMNTGTQKITINRSVYDPTTGNSTANPRQQMTLVSSFLDGSQIYGTDNATVWNLRDHVSGKGLLKVTMLNGLELPPIDTFGLPVENNAHVYNDSQLYLLGDVRGNENPALTVMHTIFIREHNRRARQLATANPTWTDEQLYQEARRWVIAHLQHITFDEYLPITFGDGVVDYPGYNDTIDPTIYTEFSTGAFRYGHSEVEEWIWRLDANGSVIPEGHLHLRDSYYNSPNTIGKVGIESIVRGMALNTQNAVDIYFVDDLRNFLFGQPGGGGFDLAAVNIQRGRDHGIPSFNDLRRLYGLDPYTNWADINDDPAVWKKLAAAYVDIEDCDVYVCGLAETHDLGNVGETFGAVIIDQYQRIRDADRWWYENDQWDAATLTEIRATTLKDIVLRNTPSIGANELQCFLMAGPDGCGRPVPNRGPGPAYSKYDWIIGLTKKTPAHPYYGKGHAYAFTINGMEGPTLNLTRGNVYYIRCQSSCAHAFVFLLQPDENGTVLGPLTYVGQAGGDGDVNFDGTIHNHGCIDYNGEMALIVGYDAPDYFYYQCDFHNMLMGGNILVNGPKTYPEASSAREFAKPFLASIAAGTAVYVL